MTDWDKKFAQNAKRSQRENLALARKCKIIGDWRGRAEWLNAAWRMRKIAMEAEQRVLRKEKRN